MATARQVATRARRRDILDAALALFVERGASETTVDDIRERSGASIGSIYHHFDGGKDGIAATLYLETISQYQAGFLAELRRHRQAATGVRATVRYHLRWVESHCDAARFLFNYGESELPSRTNDELAELNRHLFAEVRAWATEVGAAELTDVPIDLATSIWLGPAQQFARRWLSGGSGSPIDRAGQLLADAAWAALSAAAHANARTGRHGTNRRR
jgi:AcrR family transcriptional regulator